jgi:hypothetical protein
MPFLLIQKYTMKLEHLAGFRLGNSKRDNEVVK